MAQAFVTLATNDRYALGALVLAHSLREVQTTKQLCILITPGVSDDIRFQLYNTFNSVVSVDVMDSNDSAHLAILKRPELGVTFTKLHCWTLTQYQKCVFLDADMLAVQNADELFDQPELSAACDIGWPDCFNSGLFVFTPSQDTYSRLLQHAETCGSFDGGDQGVLNTFFTNWNRLSFVYNMVASVTYTYLPAYKQYGKDVKFVHFLGATKPWQQTFHYSSGTVVTQPGQEHVSSHLNTWWRIFITSVKPRLPEGVSAPLNEVTEPQAEIKPSQDAHAIEHNSNETQQTFEPEHTYTNNQQQVITNTEDTRFGHSSHSINTAHTSSSENLAMIGYAQQPSTHSSENLPMKEHTEQFPHTHCSEDHATIEQQSHVYSSETLVTVEQPYCISSSENLTPQKHVEQTTLSDNTRTSGKVDLNDGEIIRDKEANFGMGHSVKEFPKSDNASSTIDREIQICEVNTVSTVTPITNNKPGLELEVPFDQSSSNVVRTNLHLPSEGEAPEDVNTPIHVSDSQNIATFPTSCYNNHVCSSSVQSHAQPTTTPTSHTLSTIPSTLPYRSSSNLSPRPANVPELRHTVENKGKDPVRKPSLWAGRSGRVPPHDRFENPFQPLINPRIPSPFSGHRTASAVSARGPLSELSEQLTGLNVTQDESIEESRRRWEQGQPDFRGRDSFENILAHIDSKLNN